MTTLSKLWSIGCEACCPPRRCCSPSVCYSMAIEVGGCDFGFPQEGCVEDTFSGSATVLLSPYATTCGFGGVASDISAASLFYFFTAFMDLESGVLDVSVYQRNTAGICKATAVYEFTPRTAGESCDTFTATLTSSSGVCTWPGALSLIATAECVPIDDLACGPLCLQFRIEGVTDDGCTECSDFNAIFFLARSLDCVWLSGDATTGYCIAYHLGTLGRWVLAYDGPTTTWTLAVLVYDGGLLGSVVTYTLADSTSVFPKTLSLDSAASGCDGWPATVNISVCVGDEVFGGCCQDGDSTGIGICGEVDEATCTSSGGTWLGEGTTCCGRACNACPDSNEDSTLILRNVTGTEEHQFAWDAGDGRWECADDIDGQGYQPFAIECGYGTCGAGEFAIYPISLIVGETCIPATNETFTLFTQSYRLYWDGCQ